MITDIFQGGIRMHPIFIVFIVGFLVQGTKVIIDFVKYKRLYRGHIFTAGGFPSFHSGIATCVTLLALFEYGFDSAIFAIAFAFSMLFAYDAMNLRYEAGQHAHYINDLRIDLQGVLTRKNKGPLKERIGHTREEVAGGIIFGLILTSLLYYYFVVA
ncbi:MAG: divergent PAP2 family protein [Candidatus Absconditicoccaceae bacterium]